MSTAVQISTNVEFIQANTTTNPGFLLLPSTFTVPGRILTIKDVAGTFGRNPLTLSTITGTFENGDNRKRLTEPFGYLTIASDGINKWYNLDGTSLASYTVANLTNNLGISTPTISSANTTVSTLSLFDRSFIQPSTIFARSTLLFLGSTVIGGCKVGPTQFLSLPRDFLPNQIAGLNLWLDAADTSTILLRGNTVINVTDKSRSGSVVTTLNNTNVVYEPSGFLGRPSFNMVNGRIKGNFSTTVPITNYTNTTFIVTQLISLPLVNGSACMAIAQSPTGSTTFLRNIDYSDVANITYRCTGFLTNVVVTYNNVAKTAGVPYIFNTNFLNGNNAPIFMRYNGTTLGVTTQNLTTAMTTSPTSFFIGTDGFNDGVTDATNTNTWTGRISEILVYNVQLTIAQQQQVEGYLAWKWGMVTNLPLNHPFRFVPPYS